MKVVIDISEDAFKYIKDNKKLGWIGDYELAEVIANGRPMLNGEWIVNPKVLYFDSEKELYNWNDVFEYECSDCGYVYIAEKNCGKNYCPNCGRRMKKESEEEE